MDKKFQWWMPVKPAVVSQYWGQNPEFYQKVYDIKSHNGWDIVGEKGQIIRAAHDGTVTYTGEDGRGGLGVVIRTTEQFDYNGKLTFFKSIYWHCLPDSFLVTPGQFVKAGTPIAKCDSTGFVGNSHLHFGIKPVLQGEYDWEWLNFEQDNGWRGAIDPAPYFNGFFAEDAVLVLGLLNRVIELLKLKVAELQRLVAPLGKILNKKLNLDSMDTNFLTSTASAEKWSLTIKSIIAAFLPVLKNLLGIEIWNDDVNKVVDAVFTLIALGYAIKGHLRTKKILQGIKK